MSYVKHRTTIEQRLAVRMLWHSTNRETHSAEFIGVVFDLSRPTVLELCASIPRVGAELDLDALKPSWIADRQRKALTITDEDWTLSLIAASEYFGTRLTKSSDTLRVLLEQAHSQAQRIAA